MSYKNNHYVPRLVLRRFADKVSVYNIKEDDLWGTIEMSFNNMWFLDSAPSEWKDIWNNLMKEAQRVYIEAKDNMIMYQYYYDLAVEVLCV